jgi:hypothetical protein
MRTGFVPPPVAPTDRTSQLKLLRDQGALTQGVRGDLTEDPL